jgi:hypothetical protein
LRRPRRRIAGAALAAASLLVAAGAAGAAGPELGTVKALPPDTPCLGAASRDTLHPCANPSLRLTVAPDPIQAVLTPYAPCGSLRRLGKALPCQFGTASDQSVADVALVGDSHAGHWRAALRTLAQAERWRGVSLTKTSCPFTRARVSLPKARRGTCDGWPDDVLAWLRRHPEIHTVFVSNHSGAPVKAAPGRSAYATKVDGYTRILRALPSSVTDVFVLRDVPLRRLRTLDCVEAAMSARKRPGTTCAVRRDDVLRPDAGASAVRRLDAPRYHEIDLTPFFCSSRLCFPVIGGVLVNKDTDHLTTSYAATLAPYILRRVRAILRHKAAAGAGTSDLMTADVPTPDVAATR